MLRNNSSYNRHILSTKNSKNRGFPESTCSNNEKVKLSTTLTVNEISNAYPNPRSPVTLSQEKRLLLDNPYSLKDVSIEETSSENMKGNNGGNFFLDNGYYARMANLYLSRESGSTDLSSLPAYVLISDGSNIMSAKLMIGKPAPDFSTMAVVDGEFKTVKLSQFKGKYVVLFFWPRDFTFVCPTEIIAFSDRADEFRKINCEIIGCSTDSHFTHFAWTQQSRKEGGLGEMNIPLLADPSHSISRAYGVLKDDEGLAYRGLFIIDGKGILRQITINDLPVGRSVDETLRLVQAFKFCDEHGEVCPAGWKPGQPTIKPSVKESKKFFAKATPESDDS